MLDRCQAITRSQPKIPYTYYNEINNVKDEQTQGFLNKQEFESIHTHIKQTLPTLSQLSPKFKKFLHGVFKECKKVRTHSKGWTR